MPRKTWAAYEKVTAADVNTNLSDQSVMRFASAVARTAAIPSPTEGMISYRDDGDVVEMYNGTAWVAAGPGSVLSSVWSKGAAVDTASTQVTAAWPKTTWLELVASMSVDTIIYGFQFLRSSGSWTGTGSALVEFGTGAAGSEVVRHAHYVPITGSFPAFSGVIPYGIFVPAGTRLAVRWTGAPTSASNMYFNLFHVGSAGWVQYQGAATGLTALSGTSWVEIAATPPVAGGVYVTGIGYAANASFTAKVRLGLGASGSEVGATGYQLLTSGNVVAEPQWISPFLWTASTRLAVQCDTTAITDNVTVYWRESLA